jgi:hypothetical protein
VSRLRAVRPCTNITDMENIQALIDREETLKDKLKAVRQKLKTALIESDAYKAILDKVLEDDGEFKVSEKVAKAHALKAARAYYAADQDEEKNQ